MGPLAAVLTTLALLCIPLPALPAFAINIQGTGTYPGAWNTITDNLAGDLNPLSGVTTVIPGAGLPPLTGSNASVDSAITDRLNRTLGPNASTAGDVQSTVAPEPVTMFLGGTGLLIIYVIWRCLFGR